MGLRRENKQANGSRRIVATTSSNSIAGFDEFSIDEPEHLEVAASSLVAASASR